MSRHAEENDLETHGLRERPRVYRPCPKCRRAVLLADDNRLDGEPEAYRCPSCGAGFRLVDP